MIHLLVTNYAVSMDQLSLDGSSWASAKHTTVNTTEWLTFKHVKLPAAVDSGAADSVAPKNRRNYSVTGLRIRSNASWVRLAKNLLDYNVLKALIEIKKYLITLSLL